MGMDGWVWKFIQKLSLPRLGRFGGARKGMGVKRGRGIGQGRRRKGRGGRQKRRIRKVRKQWEAAAGLLRHRRFSHRHAWAPPAPRQGSMPFTPESSSHSRVNTMGRESLPLEGCGPAPPAAAWRTAVVHSRDVCDFALPTGFVQSGRLSTLYPNAGTLVLALRHLLFQPATQFQVTRGNTNVRLTRERMGGLRGKPRRSSASARE